MNSIMPANMITDDEMNQFLERHSIPKLTQEEIYNLNRPTSSKENVSSIKSFQKAQMVSVVNSIEHLRKK